MSRLHTGIFQEIKKGGGEAWRINLEISLHSVKNLGALEVECYLSPNIRLSCKTDISMILINVSDFVFLRPQSQWNVHGQVLWTQSLPSRSTES